MGNWELVWPALIRQNIVLQMIFNLVSVSIYFDKVDVPNLVTYLEKTPIFEWNMVICDSKNRYQKVMCSKEIGLHV